MAGDEVKAPAEPEKHYLEPAHAQVVKLAIEMRQSELQQVQTNFQTRCTPLLEPLGLKPTDSVHFGVEQDGRVFYTVKPPATLGDKVVDAAKAKAAGERARNAARSRAGRGKRK